MSATLVGQESERDKGRAIWWWWAEGDRFALFLSEESIVRTVPGTVLRIRVRVVRVAAESSVASDVREVPSFGMNDVPDLL
jgi:hypothetical protein